MNRFHRWSRELDVDYVDLRARMDFLEDYLFEGYEPTRGGRRFAERLGQWLDGVGDDDDQRLLFELLDFIYFVGQDEFDVLYREAFNGSVMWWLGGELTNLVDADAGDKLEELIESTWFCPITDSMQIARFHHLNSIKGKDLRPDWRTLASLGSRDKIRAYMAEERLTRLVLLEDFVGTGRQASAAVDFACGLADDLPILVLPLIIAPRGLDALERATAGVRERVEINPAVVLPRVSILGPDADAGEPDRFPSFRDLFRRLDPCVGAKGTDPDERAFGFGRLGTLFIMHTNCPNNAPPVLHHSSDTWSPLFPRSSRR